jgi:hypothetical protein
VLVQYMQVSISTLRNIGILTCSVKGRRMIRCRKWQTEDIPCWQ